MGVVLRLEFGWVKAAFCGLVINVEGFNPGDFDSKYFYENV